MNTATATRTYTLSLPVRTDAGDARRVEIATASLLAAYAASKVAK